MKKLIALLLILALVFACSSCSVKTGGTDTPNGGTNNENGTGGDTLPSGLTVVVPPYKDYGRGTQDFKSLVYSRPNMQAVIDSFEQATETVRSNELTVEEQIGKIRELEAPLTDVKTMYSLSQIYNNKDSSVEYWQGEYEYISTNYPRLSQAVEDLLVACAKSEHRAVFESDYFGYSLAEYVDGGIYSDEVVQLMAEEARLESDYSSISTANVRITYNGIDSGIRWEGTVDEVTAMAREYFKHDDASYERCLMAIDVLYEAARLEVEKPIFIELIKVRRLIADELGYDSYAELAYDSMGYDYTEKEMLALLEDIGEYVAPVANTLEYSVFQHYFTTNVQPRLNSTVMINTLYEVYNELGGEYADAYSYMLQHGLYDVAPSSANRYNGAFTAYIDSNASPFVFMTSSGFLRDYNTLSHEFGHFFDSYVNYGVDSSLAISEISSQALELLTLTKLKNNIPAASYTYLEYYTMFTFLNSVLLTQSFYTAFEHMAYQLSYDEITENSLARAVDDAFALVFGDDMTLEGDLSYVAIPHTFLYPFYVESYVTSAIVSLDIFFAESGDPSYMSDGFTLYDTLIHRGEETLGFTEQLHAVGIDSPFEGGKIREIANSIYFRIVGKHYYKNSNNGVNAA